MTRKFKVRREMKKAQTGSPSLNSQASPFKPSIGWIKRLSKVVECVAQPSKFPLTDFRFYNSVILLDESLSGLNPFNLLACGLPTVLRIKPDVPARPPSTRYLADLPWRDSHPLDYTTLPGRTEDATPMAPWLIILKINIMIGGFDKLCARFNFVVFLTTK
mgnify:CR=1 FL=1